VEATVAGRKAGAAKGGRSRRAAETPRFTSPAELREVLDALLTAVDADDRAGTLVRAASPRIRFEFTDRGVILNLAAADGREHNLRWRFDDEIDWEPRLRLWMDSAVANRYLQGSESLAIAIARGRVRHEGDARAALRYVPAMRCFVEPYRRLVRDRFPRLAIASAAA
jgi:hypothetical protein